MTVGRSSSKINEVNEPLRVLVVGLVPGLEFLRLIYPKLYCSDSTSELTRE